MERRVRACRKLSLDVRDSATFGRYRTLSDISENDELMTIHERQENHTNSSLDSVGEETGYKLPRVHEVVLAGDVEALRQLVAAGADINVLDKDGWPPLHTAIKAGKSECAAFLLKHDAGDFYYNKQKEQYEKRLETSKKPRRKFSYWR